LIAQAHALLDKLDVHDDQVLSCVLRLAAVWITAPLTAGAAMAL
jgi:hypothetical protein